MPQATFYHGDPRMVDYTPGSAVTAGDIIVQGVTPMIAHRDIPANRKGALAAGGGVYDCDCNASIGAGVAVWWDDTNNRVTTTATSNTHFGTTTEASRLSNTKVRVRHEPQGVSGVIV